MSQLFSTVYGVVQRHDAPEASDIERNRLALFFRISSWMSAKRLTFMLHSTYLPPGCMVGMVDRRDTYAANCLERFKKIAVTVMAAIKVRDDPQNGHEDRLALMEVLDQIWFDRLLLVQLLWAKLRAHGWTRAPLYHFIWVYFSGIMHTKYVLEDALQHANHLVRSGRKQDIRPVRLAFQVATSPRLDECCNVPVVSVEAGDLAQHGNYDVLAEDFLLRKENKERKPAQVILDAMECLQSKGFQTKPSGTAVDDSSVGAIMALQFTEANDFQGISALWPSALLQCCFIYRRKIDSCFFLAQEHLNYTTVGWKLETLESSGKRFFKSPQLLGCEDKLAINNLCFLKVTGLESPGIDMSEEFEGVPFKLSPRNDLPRDLRCHGSLFEQTEPPETLIKHFVRNRSLVNMTDSVLNTIIMALQIPMHKIGEKNITKQSRLYSVIRHVFPDLDAALHLQILEEFLSKTLKGADLVLDQIPEQVARGAIKCLSPEEQEFDFKDLAQALDHRLLVSQVESAKRQVLDTRKKAEHETPTCIKDLKPSHKGVLLHWDFGIGAFEAYYPAGKPSRSQSFAWSGPDCRATSQLHALQLALNFLWDNHKEKKRDCALRPNAETIKSCLAEAHAELRDLARLSQPAAYVNGDDDDLDLDSPVQSGPGGVHGRARSTPLLQPPYPPIPREVS